MPGPQATLSPARPSSPVRGGAWREEVPVVAAVSAGGALGAAARYGISVALPHPPGSFAWSTFLVNAVGCLLIGVLMAFLARGWAASRLTRPFLGVGVLGGFTTFSTYVMDVHVALTAGAAGGALVYLAATVLVAVPCAWAGEAGAGALLGGTRR